MQSFDQAVVIMTDLTTDFLLAIFESEDIVIYTVKLEDFGSTTKLLVINARSTDSKEFCD